MTIGFTGTMITVTGAVATPSPDPGPTVTVVSAGVTVAWAEENTGKSAKLELNIRPVNRRFMSDIRSFLQVDCTTQNPYILGF